MEKKWVGCAPENFRKGRPQGHVPLAIVIHIMEGSLQGTDAWFRNPKAAVSAHYGVGKTGTIHQYVEESDTAFHAGKAADPKAQLVKDRPGVNPNYYTVGIEHEGFADTDWTDAMYAASSTLIRDIADRWAIPLERACVLAHREIRATKTCPGFKVDIGRLIAGARALPSTILDKTFRLKTTSRANLRKAAPSTSAPVLRVIPANAELETSGFTGTGEKVNGNPCWYRDQEGNYLWAGATDQPNPHVSSA